ncbi:hypothetical protein D0T53_06655 [Dysgonomonas sp. 216]|uniref:glycoside hydrolase family 25 protein n=1 Tax=Dysgonomonas sp. 216 TaxID=2302934 RepID=UPI0013D6F43E|nr:GH25 family lysozyme [Dysgonomonas sp. 216]NDW18595.1 hypothetical protein [Dysgonomonas sp. 216]
MSPPVRKKKKYQKIPVKGVFIAVLMILSIGAIIYYLKGQLSKQPNSFKKNEYLVRGVDLSHHNPIINWSELRGHGVSFVYMKATGGVSHKDRNYAYNYEAVKKSGLKAGTYHFYLFAASGKEQARHFINIAKCESGDMFPAIDVEHSQHNLYSKDTVYIKRVVDELKVLENELYEYYGCHPLIYTNKECYNLYVKDNFPSNYIWMCDLREEPSYVKDWVIWQFSHKGQLEGVDGNVDLNYFRYAHNELYKFLIP